MPSNPQTSTSPTKAQAAGAVPGDFQTPDQAMSLDDALADELQSILDEARAEAGHASGTAPLISASHSTDSVSTPAAAPAAVDIPYPGADATPVIDLTAPRHTTSASSNPENVLPSPALPAIPSNLTTPPPAASGVGDAGDGEFDASFATPEEVVNAAQEPVAEAEDAIGKLDRELHELIQLTRVPGAQDVASQAPDALAAAADQDSRPVTDAALNDEVLSAELADIDRQLREINGIVDEAVNPEAGSAPVGTPVAATPDDTATFEAPSDVTSAASAALVHNSASPTSPPASADANAAAVQQDSVNQDAGGLPAVTLPADGSVASVGLQSAGADAMATSPMASVSKPSSSATTVPTPAPATSTPSAPGAPPSLHQIDEFLAGHADNAVAGDFETAHDVMAADQAAAATAPAFAKSPDAPPSAPAVPVEPTVAVAEPAPVSPAPLVNSAEPAATANPATAATAPGSKRRLAGWVRGAVSFSAGLTGRTAFHVCSLLNQPLRKVSDSTRKLVGYAGLITAANGSVLLLIKLISTMKGGH